MTRILKDGLYWEVASKSKAWYCYLTAMSPREICIVMPDPDVKGMWWANFKATVSKQQLKAINAFVQTL